MADSRPTRPDLAGFLIADFCASRVQHFSGIEPPELSVEPLLHAQELPTTRCASLLVFLVFVWRRSHSSFFP